VRRVNCDYFKGSLPLQYDAVEYARCVLTFRRPLIIALTKEAESRNLRKGLYIDQTTRRRIAEYRLSQQSPLWKPQIPRFVLLLYITVFFRRLHIPTNVCGSSVAAYIVWNSTHSSWGNVGECELGESGWHFLESRKAGSRGVNIIDR